MNQPHISHDIFLQVFAGSMIINQPTNIKSSSSCNDVMDIEDQAKDFTLNNSHSFITCNTLDFYIESKLAELDVPNELDDEMSSNSSKKSSGRWTSISNGRLGPEHVTFDMTSNFGSLKMDCDKLSLSSHSSFSSMKANVAVFKGKWMYEVMLGTKGVMQIGWATHKCTFSHEKGVGDTRDSYAYDGNRVRKWNLTTYKYGDAWNCGDVIGCAIDLDEGTVDFYRNGKHLGQAFNRVRIGPGFAYFPAVSMAFNESLTANFGGTPIRYPIDGYQSLQMAPYIETKKASLMIDWLFNLVMMEVKYESNSSCGHFLNSSSANPSLNTYLISNLILKRLSSLITNKYIVEECLLKKLLLYCNNNQYVHCLLDILWLLLEKSQIIECLDHLVVGIVNGYRCSYINDRLDNFNGNICDSLSANNCSINLMHPYGNSLSLPGKNIPLSLFTQKQYLLVFLLLIQHHTTRGYLLRKVLFDKIKFPQLLVLRAFLDNNFLEEKVFPNLEVNDLMSSDALKYLKSTEIENSLMELESLHHMILDTLIFQDEICRIVFISKFDSFLKENSNNYTLSRGSVNGPNSSYPLSVTSCIFHRLTSLIRTQYENMVNVIPISFFVDSSCVANDVSRVGGLVTNLFKIYDKDISKYIETATSMNPLLKHVYILIDGLVRLYSTGAHKQLGKYFSVQESLIELINALHELEKSKHIIEDDETLSVIENSSKILEKELLHRARQSALINTIVLTSSKRADIYWLLKLLLNTLEHASSSGYLFGFVPDYYIESCLNLCHAVRFYFGPSSSISSNSKSNFFCPAFTPDQQNEYEELLKQFCTFIASHYGDDRAANSDLKENIAQALALLVSCSETLKLLEEIDPPSRLKMIKSLTVPYENRTWTQSNWILLRIWKGDGFAYRYTGSPNLGSKFCSPQPNKELFSNFNHLKPCPSKIFQKEIGDYLTSDREISNSFISSILSQLNWSFSEFIGMLQEIQNAGNSPNKVFIDSRQLRICCTCFDLTLALLRVLEMIVNINPFLVTKTEGNDLILTQLCTMLNQVLNRLTVPTGCFEFVTDLDIPGLELVSHFPMLSAVAGLIVGLVLKGPIESREAAINAIISDASFLPSSMNHLIGKTDNTRKCFSFVACGEVSQDEINFLTESIDILMSKYSALEISKSAEEIEDDDMCTICYTYRKTAIFKPCGHRSCKSCISMHFMRHQECFFCKALLEKVVFCDSDQVLLPKK